VPVSRIWGPAIGSSSAWTEQSKGSRIDRRRLLIHVAAVTVPSSSLQAARVGVSTASSPKSFLAIRIGQNVVPIVKSRSRRLQSAISSTRERTKSRHSACAWRSQPTLTVSDLCSLVSKIFRGDRASRDLILPTVHHLSFHVPAAPPARTRWRRNRFYIMRSHPNRLRPRPRGPRQR